MRIRLSFASTWVNRLVQSRVQRQLTTNGKCIVTRPPIPIIA